MSEGLKAVHEALKKAKITGVEASEWRSSVVLNGRVASWDKKIEAGYAATGKGYKGVVNDIEVDNVATDSMYVPRLNDGFLEGKHFDVAIIGGGVTGSAIARQLSKYNVSVVLCEKEEDVAKHASGRNDGMVHPGFAASPGSKKANYNVRGNRMYTDICKELDVEFIRNGSIMLFGNPFIRLLYPLMASRAKKNGIGGWDYYSRKKVRRVEPNVIDSQHGGLYMPSAGILSPYKMTIAFAENAVQNGVVVSLNTVVTGFEMEAARIGRVTTNRGTFSAGVVINAAGIWADKIAEYADDRFFSLHGRKGVDAILDIKTGRYQKHNTAMPPIIQADSKTKGGGLVLTPEGNILLGPTAEEVPFRENYSTDMEHLDELKKHMRLNKLLDKSQIITYFAGIRACTYEEDFIIEPSEHVNNLVHAAGIQSPGLASAPAIAEDVVKMTVGILSKSMDVTLKQNFNPRRQSPPELKRMSLEKRAELIKKNPEYGRIVCRCEEISEGEIRDALRSPIPVLSVDGLKRRARTGAGRCHGGFCTPRVLEIMSEEFNCDMTAIHKKGDHSEFFYGHTKDDVDYAGKTVKLKSLQDEV